MNQASKENALLEQTLLPEFERATLLRESSKKLTGDRELCLFVLLSLFILKGEAEIRKTQRSCLAPSTT